MLSKPKLFEGFGHAPPAKPSKINLRAASSSITSSSIEFPSLEKFTLSLLTLSDSLNKFEHNWKNENTSKYMKIRIKHVYPQYTTSTLAVCDRGCGSTNGRGRARPWQKLCYFDERIIKEDRNKENIGRHNKKNTQSRPRVSRRRIANMAKHCWPITYVPCICSEESTQRSQRKTTVCQKWQRPEWTWNELRLPGLPAILSPVQQCFSRKFALLSSLVQPWWPNAAKPIMKLSLVPRSGRSGENLADPTSLIAVPEFASLLK